MAFLRTKEEETMEYRLGPLQSCLSRSSQQKNVQHVSDQSRISAVILQTEVYSGFLLVADDEFDTISE